MLSVCPECRQEIEEICYDCGCFVEKVELITTDFASRKRRSPKGYEKRFHFKDVLNQVQGTDKFEIGEDMLELIKKELPEDLYPMYRILERIMQSNKINQSVGIAVRSMNTEECQATTGNKEMCNIIGDLPDVKVKDSTFIWAIQVVSSTSPHINASADSTQNLIRIQKSLINALSDKPASLACVVGHELAHLIEDHHKKILSKNTVVTRWYKIRFKK